eukprot:CAMPEP_0176071754 /NCGR_PEP_ID=MMETSP0120_2-20121206/35841_1 /TAXON_ID=160619 /ORGANISM="Kryptoperidinium foliaceum, Strain CCMP 1326" /LENGTH=197 /DNA_ID=CAMNT_0017405415 /DNA_START=75 /DNA_END=668 /DNA_ORIENTATION=-
MAAAASLVAALPLASCAEVRLRREGAAWASLRADGKPGCPVDYDVPLDDLKPSPLHLSSVNNFVDHIDTWWTEKRVEHYFNPNAPRDYKIAPSPISGCGMYATKLIKQGERVGPVWVPDSDWGFIVHFTPWFGRAINHCPDSNTHLERLEDKSVWTVASRDIFPGEELTGNYNEAHSQFPHLVQGADPSWTCKKTEV